MPSRDARTAYCLDQASQCAKAASAATKEAYANLEQGWLQLAPPIAESEHRIPSEAHPRRRAKRPR
jgi:hypothetical protein